MSAGATPEDIANVCKLLERLRTGELNVIPGVNQHDLKANASTELLQRVESVLTDHLRRMQAPIGDGGPAFPIDSVSQNQATGETTVHQSHGGMTLRDYFAAKAMASLVAGDGAQDICDHDSRYTGGNFADVVALCSYEFADAMLKARSA
jgi:peptide subunit release factor RF-3